VQKKKFKKREKESDREKKLERGKKREEKKERQKNKYMHVIPLQNELDPNIQQRL
jgi:hypothetical protein